jgi:transposase-like protein
VTATTVEDPAIWKKRVEGLEASGQSCRKYAKQIGVNPNTLAGWRWKLRRRASAASSTKARVPATRECDFVDVTQQIAAALVTETGVIEVELGGAIVRVRGEVDSKMLVRVLRAVGGQRR